MDPGSADGPSPRVEPVYRSAGRLARGYRRRTAAIVSGRSGKPFRAVGAAPEPGITDKTRAAHLPAHIPASAIRAFDFLRITGEYKPFKAVLTRLAEVFVDRHPFLLFSTPGRKRFRAKNFNRLTWMSRNRWISYTVFSEDQEASGY